MGREWPWHLDQQCSRLREILQILWNFSYSQILFFTHGGDMVLEPTLSCAILYFAHFLQNSHTYIHFQGWYLLSLQMTTKTFQLARNFFSFDFTNLGN